MKKFIEPEIEVIEMQAADVITTSVELPPVDDGLGWG